MNNKTISSVKLPMYIRNHYMYKRLARLDKCVLEAISVRNLCLRLYLALCLGRSSGRILWLLSDVILLNKVLHSSSLE